VKTEATEGHAADDSAERVCGRPWLVMLSTSRMKIFKWVLLGTVLIQLIPFGRNHKNPPETREPAWNSPQTRELIHRACFDCHSNETVWPWYSNIAPVSWLVQSDVNDGRSHLNFTEWDRPQRHAKDVPDQVRKGDMPPWFYLPMHATAKLTGAEKQVLIDGAEKSLGPQQAPDRP
jgi:Haem-binding domain